jgi:hypothetical protein
MQAVSGILLTLQGGASQMEVQRTLPSLWLVRFSHLGNSFKLDILLAILA